MKMQAPLLKQRDVLCYLNGGYLHEDDAKISATDRGFMFGDGVYEVVRAIDGEFFEWNRHLARLRSGVSGLSIREDAFDEAEVRDVAHRLLRENDLLGGHANVYIQVTRGCAPRTHSFPRKNVPTTIFLSVTRFDTPIELQKRGARAILHPDVRWTRCDLKTLNLLPNILAKQKAVEAGVFEAVLVRQGVITEGASTNVFSVSGGELRTHPVSNLILAGVTRAVVCDLAREVDIPVKEDPILWDDVFDVEELFLTGTTTDVQPVTELDGRRIGQGQPGPITHCLQDMLRERMEKAASPQLT